MSYRFGMNGNDLNWDAVLYGNRRLEFCTMCDGGNEDEGTYCEGHVIAHCKVRESIPVSEEELIQMIKDDNVGCLQYLDWLFFHDTNDNFVTPSKTGIPDDLLTEEYIQERDEQERD